MITVNSWDELLERGVDCLVGDIQPQDIGYGDRVELTIRIQGEAWDGYFDYRGARYVDQLQRAVNRFYIDQGGLISDLRSLNKLLRIRVKVESGSSWITVKMDEVLKVLADKLSGRQVVFLASMAMAAAVGAYIHGQRLDHDIQKIKTAAAAEQQAVVGEALKTALEIIERQDMQKPLRTLINSMGEDDHITLPGAQPISKEKAKALYPRKPKADKHSGNFDSTYRITSIDFEKAPAVFKLYKDGLEFSAEAHIAGPDLDRLADEIKQVVASGGHLDAPLHVFILYTDRGIVSASVSGIGPPRTSSGDIQTLVQKW